MRNIGNIVHYHSCFQSYYHEKKEGELMILSDKFVCEDRERSTYFKHVAAPIFRRSFTVSEPVKRAEISICGIGFYDLFVNGEKITKGYLAPYI